MSKILILGASGQIARHDQARNVIAAMKATGVRRLVFVLSLGIYDEVPGAFGEWNRRTIGEDLKPKYDRRAPSRKSSLLTSETSRSILAPT